MGRRRGSLSSLLGPLRVTMGGLGEPLGESWEVGRPCERFGEPLGTPWGAFGDALGTLWRLLRSLRGRLGVSWGAFGRAVGGHEALRTIWEAFGDA